VTSSPSSPGSGASAPPWPEGQPLTKTRLIRAAGLRWPVEEGFEFRQAAIDATGGVAVGRADPDGQEVRAHLGPPVAGGGAGAAPPGDLSNAAAPGGQGEVFEGDRRVGVGRLGWAAPAGVGGGDRYRVDRVRGGVGVDPHHVGPAPFGKGEAEQRAITVAGIGHHRALRQPPVLAHLIDHVQREAPPLPMPYIVRDTGPDPPVPCGLRPGRIADHGVIPGDGGKSAASSPPPVRYR
jgi:hypothetical protein